MLIKIHKSYRDIISVCDSELLGKRFEQGNHTLELTDFYDGDEIEEEELIELLQDYNKEDATFNIVGKKSINAALKAGIIDEQGIKNVQEIPFALVLL